MSNSIDLYHRDSNAQQYQNGDYDNGKNIFDRIQDRIENFFSKGYNIARFVFFIIIMIYILYIFVTALSSVPEGESLTISFFYSQFAKNFFDLRNNFPIFEYIFTIISNLVSSNQVNFLIFLSTMVGTLLLLMCLCP